MCSNMTLKQEENILNYYLARLYFTELTAYPVFFGGERDGGSEYECNVTKKCSPAIELTT